MKSFDSCPCCGQKIELRRDSVTHAFTCPSCGCAFRHNLRKWIISLPVAVVLALGLLYLLRDSFIPPIVIAFVLVPVPGPAPRLTHLRTSPTVAITWTSVPDKTYRLQYKDNLSDADWTDLGEPVTATATSTSAFDNTGAHPRRFYRVLLLN